MEPGAPHKRGGRDNTDACGGGRLCHKVRPFPDCAMLHPGYTAAPSALVGEGWGGESDTPLPRHNAGSIWVALR
jgi:hypothetical protein